MPERATGLLLPEDHPIAAAAYADPRNWPMSLLMEGVPYTAPPPEWVYPGARPTAFDQDGVGACVAFSGTQIVDALQKTDIGSWLYDTPSAFQAYNYLKHGTPDGSYPGDGINAEGSIPQAFLEMARKFGVVDKAGKVWKISAWYSHSLASDADVEFIQQVLMNFGPVSFGTAWPGNWFAPPTGPDYVMPNPGGAVAGHAYSLIGWKTIGGVIHGTFVNSWGFWGTAQGTFRVPFSWFYTAPLGPQTVHKVVDFDDVPNPPPPDPGGSMLPIVDKTARMLDTTIGAQIYKQDGATPLVKITSGNLNISSWAALSGGFYAVNISTGGVYVVGTIKASACTNVRVLSDQTTAVAAERKRWTDWHATYPK